MFCTRSFVSNSPPDLPKLAFCCVYGPMSADTEVHLLYDLNEKSVSKRLAIRFNCKRHPSYFPTVSRRGRSTPEEARRRCRTDPKEQTPIWVRHGAQCFQRSARVVGRLAEESEIPFQQYASAGVLKVELAWIHLAIL